MRKYCALYLSIQIVGLFCPGMILPSYSQSMDASNFSNIAGERLTEFDLEGFCWGANHESGGIAEGRFGLLNVPTSSFVYLNSAAYADVGRYGDLTSCSKKQKLYIIDQSGNLFNKRDLSPDEYRKIREELIGFQHHNRTLYPQSNSVTEEEGGIGGCVLPIKWYKMDKIEYAFFSLAKNGNLALPIKQQGDYPPVEGIETCNAWGGRSVAQPKVISDTISSFKLSPQKTFIELSNFKTGSVFDLSNNYECRESNDAIAYHLMIRRDYLYNRARDLINTLDRLVTAESKNLGFEETLNANAQVAKFLMDMCEAER